jgi:gliding motility-associated-like protein
MKRILNLLFCISLTQNLFSQQIIELCEGSQTTYTYWATANTPGLFFWSIDEGPTYVGTSFYVDWNTIGTGTHEIRLLFDNTKCIDDEVYYVNVNECPVTTMYAPSAFTPNYDDLNQFWRPKGENFEYFSFLIFDRWGELVFDSGTWTPDDEMYFEGWDGTYKNRFAPEGIYTYILEWRDRKLRFHNVYGKIVLLR